MIGLPRDLPVPLFFAARGAVLPWALVVNLTLLGPAAAETLAELVGSTAAGEAIALPAGKTLGRADVSGKTVIRGSEGAILAASDDDTILAVLPGAELHLSNVDLIQEGASRFGVYVDGGTLVLEDCRIEGAFEVSVYVSAGSLAIRNCEIEAGLYGIQAAPGSTVVIENVRMTGQGDTAIRADGSALDLSEVTIANSGQNGIIATNSPAVRSDGVTISGILSNGIFLKDAASAELRRIVVQISGQAMTVEDGSDLSIDGLLLQGSTGALALNGVAGDIRLAHGKLQSGDGAVTAYFGGRGKTVVSDVEIAGGETGLYLTGANGDALFERVFLHSQTATGLFVDAILLDPGGMPLQFRDFRAIGAGQALPAFFQDSGPVEFSRAALLSAGVLPFAFDEGSAISFANSVLISAPEWIDGHIALELDPGARPSFIPFGPLAALDEGTIGSGTVQLPLAEFAERAEGDVRREIAAFAALGEFDPSVLALALEYALPAIVQADTSGALTGLALAPLADALTELALAQPADGWIWDGAAAEIALTAATGETVSATPADFPLFLAAGDYSLAIDGCAVGQVIVADGAVLRVPLPDAPFYAWRDDQGRKVRGPTLYLRPAGELAGLLAGFRPLRPGEDWGSAPVFAPRRGADRQLAAAAVASGRAAIPDLLTEMAALRVAESWVELDLPAKQVYISLDIMEQFGSREDAAWLVGLAIPDGVFVDQLETAVLIEMRLDALTDGATLPAARAALAAFQSGDATARGPAIRLVAALARSGLPEGIELLRGLERRLRDEPLKGAPNPTGIVELSRLSPDLAGDAPAVFLDRLSSAVERYLSGPFPDGEAVPIRQDHWNAAIAALAHEAIHSPPDAPPRWLPVPVEAIIGPSAWAFADPTVLMRGPLSTVGPPDLRRVNGWTFRFPENLCAALAYRTAADRQARLDALRDQVSEAVTLALVPDAEEGDQARVDETYGRVQFVLDLILGECVMSDAILRNFDRDARGEETAIFDKLDYEPLWWVRPARTRALLESFASGGERPMLHGHSAIPLAEVAALLPEGSGGYPPLREVFLARHQLQSDAFQSSHDTLTFGSERRQFRLRNAGGNGSITIAGYLDIRPILSDGRLIVAIRHSIQSPDFGGLAAMINEPDRTPYEVDNRILMFEAVTLDRGGAETAMVLEGTSASGVHFFAAPWDADLSDTALHLAMRFWDVTWEIDLPLWSSALAHDRRMAPLMSEVSP